MVVFACNSCGESLKKAQVENHIYRTRCYNSFVSCMDCTKDFDPVSYKLHIKCITEDEKYSGGNFKHKNSTLNGERKRKAWMEIIQDVHASTVANNNRDPQIVELLGYLANLQSVPTKETPFMTALDNSKRNLFHFAGTVWAMLMEEKALRDSQIQPVPPKNPPETENDSCNGGIEDDKKQNGKTEEPMVKKKKSKKMKENGTENEEETGDQEVKKKKSKKIKENGVEKEEDPGDQEVPDAELSQKLEKKKKSRKSEVNEDVAPSSNEGLSRKKVKKQKKKELFQELLNEIESGVEVLEDSGRKKKKKKKTSETEVSENGDTHVAKKKKKQSETEVSENGDVHVAKDKKKKKKKSKTLEDDAGTAAETIVEGETTESVSKKSKKRKKTADTEEQEKILPNKKGRLNDTLEEIEVPSGGKFQWKDTIEQILQSAKHTRLPLKKLRRKVFSAYAAHGGDPADKQLSDNKVAAKFDKMLHKMQNVTVKNESVQLVKLEG